MRLPEFAKRLVAFCRAWYPARAELTKVLDTLDERERDIKAMRTMMADAQSRITALKALISTMRCADGHAPLDHLGSARYGDFWLTNGVRPLDSVALKQGFCHDTYCGLAVLKGAVTREKLFSVFMGFLDLLGCEVSVVLQTSHDRTDPLELLADCIDLPILKSILWDYEDLLTNDGGTGIAVFDKAQRVEVQFYEHKVLAVYGRDLVEFESVLRDNDIECDEHIMFVDGVTHVHATTDAYCRQFQELAIRLGVDGLLETTTGHGDDWLGGLADER